MKRMKNLILAAILVMSAALQAFADIPNYPEQERDPGFLPFVLIGVGVAIIAAVIRWYKNKK